MNGAPSNGQADPQIVQALHLIHNSQSTNEHRFEALKYLEEVKSNESAPYNGYLFAADKQQPAVVRHFGLSLLEEAIRHRWLNYSGDQSIAVRDWVLKLAQSVEKEDPIFIRNKIAQLWVEVAKRSWALDWMDMDQLLVELWSGSAARKILVLEVLETLSENSFGKEDTMTALRGTELSKACVEIFAPAQVMVEHFPKRDTSVNVRYGSEGWITRVSDFLSWCNEQNQNDEDVQLCALKALSALKSVVSWAILSALSTTQCIPRICQALTSPYPPLQLIAVETLYALYYRYNYSDEDVRQLVGPMYETQTVDVLKRLYKWSCVESNDMDDEKYLLCKKFSEMIHNVGRFLRERPDVISDSADIPNFLDLILMILQNESLHVSIPVLHLWVQILQSPVVGSSPAVMNLIGPLLETCSRRLIRYELLPADSELPAMRFLSEDIDTVPEKHAFLGNYARFCKDVVDSIVLKKPSEALYHILEQADQVLQHLYDGQPAFTAREYKKTSVPALKLDAQFSVVEAALIGYGKWRNLQKAKTKEGKPPSDQQDEINNNLATWCRRLLGLTFDDPNIQQRVVALVVEFAISPLKKNAEFTILVFKYVLETKARVSGLPSPPEAVHYNEAVKEFQRFCSHQLQRIAFRTAESLIHVYDEVERSIHDYCQRVGAESEERDRCVSVLFVIVHRAPKIEETERIRRLDTFIQPALAKWQDAQLANSLQTFDGFRDLLGLSQYQRYFMDRKAHQISDWSECPLDQEGKELKARIDAATQILPLRSTKIFFQASLDKTEPGNAHHRLACTLWTKYLPVILPNLLQMISQAHRFSESSSWNNLPPECQEISRRVLKDRFWQVGISTGSRDDFYSKVEQSRTSLEGLASAIRGCLRFVRETSYRLLSTISSLGNAMYKIPDLPEPLSKAIFENAGALSTHQTGVIIEMMRPVTENCPADARTHFLTPLLTVFFDTLDRKVALEWSRIDHRTKDASENDDLVEEMKDESILRNLTFNCVTVVVRLLDPHDGIQADSHHHPTNGTSDSLRQFVLSNPQVFKSVILFCTHALQMHDSRACGLITRVLRSIVQVFTGEDPIAADIREFISTEVFKACITSLHDPYFVDIQSDLSGLIASIIKRYSAITNTPREILASLPDMTPEIVDTALYKMYKAEGNSKQQKAVVMKLLEGLRGVSISEQGKLPRPDPKKARSALQEKYMTVEAPADSKREASPDLGGVADMFA